MIEYMEPNLDSTLLPYCSLNLMQIQNGLSEVGFIGDGIRQLYSGHHHG